MPFGVAGHAVDFRPYAGSKDWPPTPEFQKQIIERPSRWGQLGCRASPRGRAGMSRRMHGMARLLEVSSRRCETFGLRLNGALRDGTGPYGDPDAFTRRVVDPRSFDGPTMRVQPRSFVGLCSSLELTASHRESHRPIRQMVSQCRPFTCEQRGVSDRSVARVRFAYAAPYDPRQLAGRAPRHSSLMLLLGQGIVHRRRRPAGTKGGR